MTRQTPAPLDRSRLSRIRDDLDHATSPRSATGIQAWIRTAEHAGVLYDENRRLQAIVDAAYEFADEMIDCVSAGSHIVADQGRQLRKRLDQAQPNRATDRARHDN